eukprot:m.167459 g.167459  ORF g.167459 m.167459 type:complete len:293 (+) comp12828_c0_seq1:42-920(+)
MASVEEADKLLANAVKKANSKGFMGGMFSSPGTKIEQAIEMCDEAANMFKMAKKWDRAADAYVQQAEFQQMVKNPFEAAACYKQAATMYKKGDVKRAVRPLEMTMELFASISKFPQACKAAMDCGELLEKEVVDIPQAIGLYEKAVDYAQMDGQSQSSESKANVKLATLLAQTEEYARAVEIFESVAESMVDNNLLKFSCKEYYLKAGLCTLASGDHVGAKVKHERYESNAAYFRDSRESRLLIALADAMENEDVDEFTQTVKEYDAVAKLDGWMTQILLTIKKSMAGEDLL